MAIIKLIYESYCGFDFIQNWILTSMATTRIYDPAQ